MSHVIGAPRRDGGSVGGAVLRAGRTTAGGVELTDVERRALGVLADAGLVPTLLYLPLDAPVELMPVDLILDDPDGPCGFLPVEMASPTAARHRQARHRAA